MRSIKHRLFYLQVDNRDQFIREWNHLKNPAEATMISHGNQTGFWFGDDMGNIMTVNGSNVNNNYNPVLLPIKPLETKNIGQLSIYSWNAGHLNYVKILRRNVAISKQVTIKIDGNMFV